MQLQSACFQHRSTHCDLSQCSLRASFEGMKLSSNSIRSHTFAFKILIHATCLAASDLIRYRMIVDYWGLDLNPGRFFRKYATPTNLRKARKLVSSVAVVARFPRRDSLCLQGQQASKPSCHFQGICASSVRW